ncbi:MAG: SGNH/GDSL hydrolase family protein [Bacteroidales bacterium]
MDALIKRVFCLLLISMVCTSVSAQFKWLNPMDAGFPVVQNQGFTAEIGKTYTRLPERASGVVSDKVMELSKQSAGLAIHFYSNAQQISVRYSVSGEIDMPNMPATGASGLDLYCIDNMGEWHLCSGNYNIGKTSTFSYNITTNEGGNNHRFEYRLFLPLYNSVTSLEIGIPNRADLQFIPVSTEKPIVFYGASIAQGACASRPAMAWSTIMQRSLELPLLNFSFSGNCMLEKEVLQFISEPNAKLYILDCMANLSDKSESEVNALITTAIKQLRKSSNAPILLVEHAGYCNESSDKKLRDDVIKVNNGLQAAYNALLADGTKNLSYLSRMELGLPADSWVDYIHLSDYGMKQQAKIIENKVREILNTFLTGSINLSNTDGRRSANLKIKTSDDINFFKGWISIGYMNSWDGTSPLSDVDIARNFVAVGNTAGNNNIALGTSGILKQTKIEWKEAAIDANTPFIAIIGDGISIKDATNIAVIKFNVSKKELLWETADQKSINISANQSEDHIAPVIGQIIEADGVKYLKLASFKYPTGIETAKNSNIKILVRNGAINISSVEKESIISVLDMSGRIYRTIIANEGTVEITAPSKGIYIISFQDKNNKQIYMTQKIIVY